MGDDDNLHFHHVTRLLVSPFKWYFFFIPDPRTNDWFLITSPIPGLTIMYLYLQFVLKWGPRYMADKQPFQLQKTMVVYNFLQVLVSCWLFHEVCNSRVVYLILHELQYWNPTNGDVSNGMTPSFFRSDYFYFKCESHVSKEFSSLISGAGCWMVEEVQLEMSAGWLLRFTRSITS